jgi:hypothetical protein
MMTTNARRSGRIGGIAMVALAAAFSPASGVMQPASARVQDGAAMSRAQGPAFPSCGTRPRTDAEIELDSARVAEFKKRGRTAKSGDLITITTYVHVIHDGVEGRVSEHTIRAQINVLNDTYAARGFRFEMAANAPGNPNPDYTDNPAWYRDATVEDELAYKTALKEGTGDDLNIYTNSGGGYLGYAYYPTVVGSSYDVLDGVVLAWGTLPGANQPGISDIPGFVYNLGDTGTHEVGHYLGLAHTFEGKCSRTNDSVADTPAERSPDFYCTAGRDTCPDRGTILLDPIHNFMDYSDDVCLFEFTAGQAERMNIQWALYRAGR